MFRAHGYCILTILSKYDEEEKPSSRRGSVTMENSRGIQADCDKRRYGKNTRYLYVKIYFIEMLPVSRAYARQSHTSVVMAVSLSS